MKTRLTTILFVVTSALLRNISLAQGTIYLSNLGELSAGSVAVASDAWVAAAFRTGTDSSGYMLNSIQLLMDQPTGGPDGFVVELYETGRTAPLLSSGTLGTLVGPDPPGDGVYEYTATGIVLGSQTSYSILLKATTPLTSGSYPWSLATTTNYVSNSGWSLNNSYQVSTDDGASWPFFIGNSLQFAVNATAIPEPSSLSLLGLSGLWLVARSLRCIVPIDNNHEALK